MSRMDRKEAIEHIKRHMVAHQIGEYPHIKLGEALSLAIEALDKQIPKKPIFEREQTSPFGVDDVPYCPNCRCDLPEVSYCEKCGQRLLWEAEE